MDGSGARRRLEGRLEEEGRVGDDARLGDGLLEREEGDGDHGDAAVEDLRGAHRRRVLAERVEAQHARQVVGGALAGVELRVDRLALDGDGEAEARDPVESVDLAQAAVEQRRHAAAGVQEAARVQLLAQRPAGGCEHGEARVLDLGLTVPRQLLRLVGEAERVEVPVAGQGLVADTHRGDERRLLGDLDVHGVGGLHERRGGALHADGGVQRGPVEREGGDDGGEHDSRGFAMRVAVKDFTSACLLFVWRFLVKVRVS
eukprot:scaffold17871_cov82-Phaeocystis_antarctica.AAC.13